MRTRISPDFQWWATVSLCLDSGPAGFERFINTLVGKTHPGAYVKLEISH
jgi:hypothetical protein